MRIQLTSKDLFLKQTEYGEIKIRFAWIDDDLTVLLLIDGGAESARYVEKGRESELVFDYMQRFSYAFLVNPNIKKTFMIGGGGFSYPQYYVNTYKDAEITVAEISKDVISAAYQFFGLKDLQEDHAKRIHVLNQDGIAWLNTSEEKYDLIINDAFLGTSAEKRDVESTRIIHDHLNPDGIYVVNVLSAVEGEKSFPLEACRVILKDHFKHIASMIVDDEVDPQILQNILIFASDSELL